MSSKGKRWKVPNRRRTVRTAEQQAAFAEAIRQGRLRNLPSLEERYWSKVEKSGPDDCWEWQGTKNEGGYGQIKVGGRRGGMELAHRVGWELVHGDKLGESQVLHRCDNPPCQKPKHWFKGTHLDNMRDRDANGRVASGERSGAHTKPESFRRHWHDRQRGNKLTADRVRALREEAGVEIKVLAKKYGISRAMAGRILARRAWRNVP